MKNISYGDQGEDVKQIQALINGFGFNLIIDGIFGPETQDAIIDFQRRSGLVADGVVGEQTWGALNSPLVVADTQQNTTGKILTSLPTTIPEENRIFSNGIEPPSAGFAALDSGGNTKTWLIILAAIAAAGLAYYVFNAEKSK